MYVCICILIIGVEHSEIPYALAANTLQIEQDMLEHWVIEAVRLGLMEAKIDQMSQVVGIVMEIYICGCSSLLLVCPIFRYESYAHLNVYL
jgi:hypothetical protein